MLDNIYLETNKKKGVGGGFEGKERRREKGRKAVTGFSVFWLGESGKERRKKILEFNSLILCLCKT